jgi:FAD:protein FMN transferase
MADAVAWLHRVDAVFSPYRADSQISRLGRGELTVGQCDQEVAEVLDLCRAAARTSGGRFSSTPGGRLDPSGMGLGGGTSFTDPLRGGRPAPLRQRCWRHPGKR